MRGWLEQEAHEVHRHGDTEHRDERLGQIAGDAQPDELEQIVMQSKARSAVFDVLTNGVPVSVGVSKAATV